MQRPMIVVADAIHTTFSPSSSAAADRDVDSLLIRDGRVRAIGRRRELMALVDEPVVVDLRGHTITPGLVDSHIHLTDWAFSLDGVDLTTAESPEVAALAVADHLRETDPDEPCVRGHGWSRNRWKEPPDREFLDRHAPNRPVVLDSQDLHGLWVNSAALEASGITDDTPDPPGGVIVRDPRGRATGVLLEAAAGMVTSRLPRPTDGALQDALAAAQSALHRMGITGVHSFPAIRSTGTPELRALQAMALAGRLRLRVLQHIPAESLDAAIAVGLASGFGDEWVRVGGIKIFLDGSLGSRTAWLGEPYLGTDDRGMPQHTAESFRALVRRAAEAGLSSTVHAIGDAAVALALDALANLAVEPAATPHRIEHAQLYPAALLRTGVSEGMIHSMQPAHLMTDWRAADELWGRARCRGAYAFGSVLAAGGVLTFGSDAPVATPDPRLGMIAATTRQDLQREPEGGWYPSERISTREALWAYTGAAAIAAGDPDRQGELRPGRYADFAVWSSDPLLLSGHALSELECVATSVGGEFVWWDPSLGRSPGESANGESAAEGPR